MLYSKHSIKLINKVQTYSNQKNHVSTPNPKLCLMKSSMKICGFWFQTWKFQKPSQELHFGVTKKDICLIFHIHVFNLFKLSWSNLGFDKIQMGKHMISDANIISKCGQTSLQLNIFLSTRFQKIEWGRLPPLAIVWIRPCYSLRPFG